jgi:hypothetical protein
MKLGALTELNGSGGALSRDFRGGALDAQGSSHTCHPIKTGRPDALTSPSSFRRQSRHQLPVPTPSKLCPATVRKFTAKNLFRKHRSPQRNARFSCTLIATKTLGASLPTGHSSRPRDRLPGVSLLVFISLLRVLLLSSRFFIPIIQRSDLVAFQRASTGCRLTTSGLAVVA